MKQIGKYLFLWIVGGSTYFLLEIIKRGYSHFTMFILGGICFIALGLINEKFSWETPLWKQSLLGGMIVTLLEFVTGYIVNILLKWNVWDYSNLPFNILGQVCLGFYFLWCIISIFAIILDDYIRYIKYGEEKPRYKLL